MGIFLGGAMDDKILVDLMVQLAGLEAERCRCQAALAKDVGAAELLVGLREEYVADAGNADVRLAESRAKQRKAEGELVALENTLDRKRTLLEASTDSRESLALQREIQGLEIRQDTLLADAYRLLEQVEKRDSDAGTLSSECVEQERQSVAKLKAIESQRALLAEALPEIEEEIRRLHSAAPSVVAKHLTRLWAKDLQATVFEKEGACSGCGFQLRPQQALTVQHGKELVRCPSCARFVVHRPWK